MQRLWPDQLRLSVFSQIPLIDLRLSLYLFAFLIIAIVFLMFSSIKCPECGYKIFWNWFNSSRSHKGKGNPLTIGVCSNCDYDPDQNKLDE